VKRGEDPVMTYKRLAGITQEQFNDEIFDAARRFVTWDMPRIEKVAARYANQHTTALTDGAMAGTKLRPINARRTMATTPSSSKFPPRKPRSASISKASRAPTTSAVFSPKRPAGATASWPLWKMARARIATPFRNPKALPILPCPTKPSSSG
jgi:hypothetical protein